jgi:hypothetical protein
MDEIIPPRRERRASARLSVALRGKSFPGARDCRIVDFTRRGARLSFDGPSPPGDRFVLVVWTSGAAFEATVKWRRGHEIGVRFDASRDLRRPAPPHLEEAQTLWLARRPRLRRRALVQNPAILKSRHRLPRRIAPAAEPVA